LTSLNEGLVVTEIAAVTVADRARFADVFADLADPDVMSAAGDER
jgi:hypothetical protein